MHHLSVGNLNLPIHSFPSLWREFEDKGFLEVSLFFFRLPYIVIESKGYVKTMRTSTKILSFVIALVRSPNWEF